MLFSSETQRNTAATTYQEAKTAQQVLSTFLDRDRALDARIDTGSQESLEEYVAQGGRMESLLRRAAKISADDKPELRSVARQTAASAPRSRSTATTAPTGSSRRPRWKRSTRSG